MITVVVPTYNERDNVEVITSAIENALLNIPYEILFVDDSKDDTPEILERIARRNPAVRYIHRETETGLGTAVVRGLEEARGEYIAVMDADLQHPPKMLCSMIDKLDAGADIVIPSRFVPGGDDGGLKLHRKLVSAVARYMGKVALKRLRKISDPTGGFFAFRREVISDVELRPIGWKILIELLARGHYCRVAEVPYRFQPRRAGNSKLTLKEQWNYIKHLGRLVSESREDRCLFLFAAVGLLGVVINMLFYGVLVKLGVTVVLAGFVSSLIALWSNFMLNELVTWSDVKQNVWSIRAIKYLTTSFVGIGINMGVLSFLYYEARVHYLLSDLIGIAIATLWNFMISNTWTWKPILKGIEVSAPQ
ncbi:glycosyltransferase [Alicyclobacillus sp. ALC3]|uniref:glycosyltransferase n=1 Tax=Alicyclobacillus sp. ALC3 TaxID=2796143 RepID=UPI0023782186|nr:glycosyltransferase family 2 protein [Alicyclobacillus sp. ALC3]WDL96105.1 glycosyltransferase family 2 protein [Alicyclobacillus sp. ALC3]